MAFLWTVERQELLKARWIEGVTASKIAEELGGGVTGSAIVGKAHRLGLSPHPAGARGFIRALAARGQRPVAPLARRPASAAPTPYRPPHFSRVQLGLSLIYRAAGERARRLAELADDQCHFPVGLAAGINQLHCGEAAEPGDVYCSDHRALCGGARMAPREEELADWLKVAGR